MFELPECVTLARQLGETVTGKRIDHAALGNSPHKFVWYNRTPDEFRRLTAGRTAGRAYSRGRWLFIPLEPGYVLVFGECGGKILFHPSQAELPRKRHLEVVFADGTALSATTQMWGAMELFERGEELKRKYIAGMRPTPADAAFSFEYFLSLIEECTDGQKRSAKGLLTQEQLIPGLGNSIAQDILFHSRLHPRHALADLSRSQKRQLYQALMSTLGEVIDRGGRSDEVDLFGRPGGYRRILDKNSVGQPCPKCRSAIGRLQYLGGTCYFCPRCQT